MGMRKGEGITPSWVMTLGAIADTLAEHPHYFIRVHCRKCREHRDLDIPALIEKVGRDYTLLNKRTRCRITPGCRGWNVFFYSTGTWTHNMFTEKQSLKWMAHDWERQKRGLD